LEAGKTGRLDKEQNNAEGDSKGCFEKDLQGCLSEHIQLNGTPTNHNGARRGVHWIGAVRGNGVGWFAAATAAGVDVEDKIARSEECGGDNEINRNVQGPIPGISPRRKDSTRRLQGYFTINEEWYRYQTKPRQRKIDSGLRKKV